MKFKELYEKGLDRRVNPAVSASDLTDETVLTEIEEYVFTPEIVAHLYEILDNIRLNKGSHVGIWINGYYGSGKSHFMKYASYCMTKQYSGKAFDRLIEAAQPMLLHVDKNTPNDNDDIYSDRSDVEDACKSNKKPINGYEILEVKAVSISKLGELKKWYSTNADVDMIMFNIGDVYDANSNRDTTFTKIFWNQFNARRGYNSSNLELAQHLEKTLDEDGKFEEFKEYVKEQGYDWGRNIERFGGGRLDLALKMAKEIDSNLSIDVIRNKILNRDVNISVVEFANEVKTYIDKKQNRNYRMLFFVDEVSQFIGEHRDLLLQLQSLVKRLDEICKSQVWIACTAQQTLEEVVTSVGGSLNDPEDEVGKILGRFEVRASLEGTKPEYITCKRILEKKADVEMFLGEMYEKDKSKLDAQFILPSTYHAYKSKEEFADYYPFVHYQLPLLKRVLESFVCLGYIDRQSRGARSLINITYSVAKETAEREIGEFVPFDKFFGLMLQGSMQHIGKRALENALQAIEIIEDEDNQKFYKRVVYVLFMICNLSEKDKLTFSATIDNVVTLLMTKVDASKAAIKEEVLQALTYLIDHSVIRKIKTDNGTDTYDFYTEEEAEVAQLIKNQKVDSNIYNDELYKMIYGHFALSSASNKETYGTKSFNIGGYVGGKHILANNADVEIHFVITSNVETPEQYSMKNSPTHLVYYMCNMAKEDREWNNAFLDYCKVMRFMQEPAQSEERQRTKKIFKERATENYEKEIKPRFQTILDTCPVISGQNVLMASDTGGAKKQERYKNAIMYHLANVYKYAKLVDRSETPRTQSDLTAKIMRPMELKLANETLSIPETKIVDYLNRQAHDVTVADVVREFGKQPYGWSEIATIYIINELVRHHQYSYTYYNNQNVSREEVAKNILKEQSKFTIEKAQAIPQCIINNFLDAWKKIFNDVNKIPVSDPMELFEYCKGFENGMLNKYLKDYRKLSHDTNGYLFSHTIDEAVELLESWQSISAPKDFFEKITAAQDNASTLIDQCKSIEQFVKEQFEAYKKISFFVTNNRDNFDFLQSNMKSTLEALRKIEEVEKPWENLPLYNKMAKKIENQLFEYKNKLLATVTENYNRVFDDLEKYAQSVNVGSDKFADRESTIAQKTSSSNFYALQANANTTSFYNEQMNKIDEARQRPDDCGDDKEPPQKPARKHRVVRLDTRTKKPMSTEADVDKYLQDLKFELMKYIDGESDIEIN